MAKLLEFQLQHHPSNEYSGLICFRINWFDRLAVQGNLKSLLPWQTSGLLQYLVGELISRVPLRVAKREEKEKKRGLFISPREARDLQVPLSLPLLFPHRTHPVGFAGVASSEDLGVPGCESRSQGGWRDSKLTQCLQHPACTSYVI